MFDMLEYHNMLKKHNLNIIYSGPIWSDGVEEIGATLRKRLELDDLPFSASQSIFSVFVEQMNNMLYYSDEKQHFSFDSGREIEVSTGVFVLGVHKKTYFLQSGNMMKLKNVEFIRDKIDYLNTLDKTQIRKYYKEQMKLENKNPGSRGAGLGLIEIAKRATSDIKYSFTPIEQDQVFFTMYVQIGEEGRM